MTSNQRQAIVDQLGNLKGDISFFEHIVLNTNYRSSESHKRVKQARQSIAKIRSLLDSIDNTNLNK